MKKGMFLAALAVCAMAFSVMVNDASAVCTITGKVMYTVQTPTGATVYVAPGPVPSFYYVFTSLTTTTGTAALVDKINNAQTSGGRVTITGSAASCPTTGVTRLGGTMTNVSLW